MPVGSVRSPTAGSIRSPKNFQEDRKGWSRYSTGSASSSNSIVLQNKIMVLGGKKVGKSSLITRWWNGTFTENCKATFKQKECEFPDGRTEKVRF